MLKSPAGMADREARSVSKKTPSDDRPSRVPLVLHRDIGENDTYSLCATIIESENHAGPYLISRAHNERL